MMDDKSSCKLKILRTYVLTALLGQLSAHATAINLLTLQVTVINHMLVNCFDRKRNKKFQISMKDDHRVEELDLP